MSGLFSSPKIKTPPPPKPVRMPVESDPEIEAAAQRARAARLAGGGAMGTRLTRQTQGASNLERTIIGSSGSKIGS